MGGNEKAAKLSGVHTNKVLFFCCVNIGVLAAVAGIATASRLVAADIFTKARSQVSLGTIIKNMKSGVPRLNGKT